MKFMLEGFKELGYLQLVGVNGGCSGYCGFSGSGYSRSYSYSVSSYSGSCGVTSGSNTSSDVSTRSKKIQEAVDASLREKKAYEYGVNDCDIWVENVLSKAGINIASEWGAAKDNCVADHETKLRSKTTDVAGSGWSVVLMTDSDKYSINHCGLANIQKDGTVLFYQNTKSANGASVEKYSSVTEFQNAYAYNDFDYYKVSN